MALRRTIAKRLIEHQTPPINDLFSQKSLTKSNFHRQLLTPPPNSNPSSSSYNATGFFRRFLQRRKINQSTLTVPELFSFPVGEMLREKMMNNEKANISNGERFRLDGLRCLEMERSTVKVDSVGISVNDARKILRFSQLQKVRSVVKLIPKNSISYSEFVSVCIDECKDSEQGVEFAKMLDEAGDVIVLGNVVFLRPDQLAKSMEKLISESIAVPNDPRKQELEKLEKQKALIDQKSLSQVRLELNCGLGFLIVQTLAFIRLTFWELGWDVMEPVCFFVTSFHFALAYMFFVKTSKEPTFEGYFQRRFKTKQRKLMDVYGFDLEKYNHLCKVFYPRHQNTVSGSLGLQDLSRGRGSNMVFS